MIIGTDRVDHEYDPQTVGPLRTEALAAVSDDRIDIHVPTRRREGRVKEQRLCTYELCEAISEESVVTFEGEAYSLNRSEHGILILMGHLPQIQQLIELKIPESKWRRSYSLYEVQWTKAVHVESKGDLFLAGCRLTFGPSRYWAF
jgi:hypothetical protein